MLVLIENCNLFVVHTLLHCTLKKLIHQILMREEVLLLRGDDGGEVLLATNFGEKYEVPVYAAILPNTLFFCCQHPLFS